MQKIFSALFLFIHKYFFKGNWFILYMEINGSERTYVFVLENTDLIRLMLSHGPSCLSIQSPSDSSLKVSLFPSLIITSRIYSPSLSLRAESHGFLLKHNQLESLWALAWCSAQCTSSAVFGVQWTIITSVKHVLQSGFRRRLALFSCPTSAVYHRKLVTQHLHNSVQALQCTLLLFLNIIMISWTGIYYICNTIALLNAKQCLNFFICNS